ncbi:RNA polymerase sigma factor [Psychroflexus tropicus]|uniref:RNA polymerase sigma factor n=1 Tax=Psychroflexus tropicus TaxID=197345 RepID=UPI00037CEFA6|nr:sigma-70 family RNA polymerase sigma factor [Psychroflexus tropicus]
MTKSADFESIYKAQQPAVMRLCLGYFGGDQDKANDVCQEIFIKVWKHMNKFEGKSQVSTWIYRIAVNTCLNALRKNKSTPQTLELQDHLVAAEDNTPGHTNARLQAMYACIEQLNPKDRSIILLVLEQEPYPEIASILGISENNLRVKIHRIKDKLSKCVSL